MDVVRVKYEGPKDKIDKSFGVLRVFKPGEVFHYPRRLWSKNLLGGDFKILRGKRAESDTPLPLPTWPSGLMTAPELFNSITWYPVEVLKEMADHYLELRKRFHRNIVIDEIHRRESLRETD
jgi:hypothetical protein